MHVLIANNIYPPIMAGGAELIVSYLAEGLVDRGHQVTVVSTCGPEMEPYPAETRNGVRVVRFFPQNLYWTFARGAKAQQDAPRTRADRYLDALNSARWHFRDGWNRDASRKLAELFRQSAPDVLHSHLITGFSATIWRWARRAGVPVVHTAHDYHLLCPRAFMLDRSWKLCVRPSLPCRAFRSWHVHTTKDVNLFVSPSQFLLDLHGKAGLPAIDTAVVGNGIPLPTIARPTREGPRNRFLLLARLTLEKGVRVVLDAMSRIPQDVPVELVIAGRGPLEADVRAAAARDPRIRYLGYLQGDAKHHALMDADHLLLPSLWYENAPVVILEAAAYGLTMIASDIGGIPEFVKEGETGSLFPAGDAAALAGRMIAATGGSRMLDELPRHAAALIANFTVPRMVESYLDHYQRYVRQAA